MSQKILRKGRLFAGNRRQDSSKEYKTEAQYKESKACFGFKAHDFEEAVEEQS